MSLRVVWPPNSRRCLHCQYQPSNLHVLILLSLLPLVRRYCHPSILPHTIHHTTRPAINCATLCACSLVSCFPKTGSTRGDQRQKSGASSAPTASCCPSWSTWKMRNTVSWHAPWPGMNRPPGHPTPQPRCRAGWRSAAVLLMLVQQRPPRWQRWTRCCLRPPSQLTLCTSHGELAAGWRS